MGCPCACKMDVMVMDVFFLIAIRDSGKVICHNSFVVHDTIMLGHHACVYDGNQLVTHDHGLEGHHFGVCINIFPCMQSFLYAVEINHLRC